MARYERPQPTARQPRGTGRDFWIEDHFDGDEACSAVYCWSFGRTRVAVFYTLYDEKGNTVTTARKLAESFERTQRLADEGRKARARFADS